MSTRVKISLISILDVVVITLLLISHYWVGEEVTYSITMAVFWSSISFIASIIGTRLPLGRAVASVGEPIDIAGIIIVGPFPIIIANVTALLVNAFSEGRERQKKLPFNIILWIFAPLLAGWILSLFRTVEAQKIDVSAILAIVSIYLVYSIAHLSHVTAAISITEKIPYIKVLKKNYLYSEIASIAVIPIAIIMIILWGDYGVMGVVLLLIPMTLISVGLKYAFERGRLDERIRKENQIAEFGKIAASVLHEIGKPISRIVMEAEQVRNTTADKQQIQHLSSIIDWAKDAGNTTRDMFAGFARQNQFNKTTINQIIQSAVAMVPIQEKHRITISINSAIRSVIWDAKQIELVISNLLINATESSTIDDIVIRVDVVDSGKLFFRKPAKIMITIIDLGEGFPSGPIAQVFDPLFSTKKGGRGMGLFLAKQIAIAHGGDLNAVPGVPRGAEFILTLPSDASRPLTD
ncbi:sensor histidine kinase [Gemmatimonadota bacterium]